MWSLDCIDAIPIGRLGGSFSLRDSLVFVRGRSTVELVADGIVGRGSLDIQGLLRGDGILKVSRGLSKPRGIVCC